MCGIAGIVDIEGNQRIERQLPLLRRMNDLLRHRGPDEDGIFHDERVGLAHRRLAIIDLGEGQQPMFSSDGKAVIVFNGEIYNFRDLRQQLESLGHDFRTHSDTETILCAWQQWGEECVHRLRGMFAFVIYDMDRGVVFLCRDRLGIKPLYYAVTRDGLLLFGSEMKSLQVHPSVSATISETAVENYFVLGYVPAPLSILEDVRKLEAGTCLKVDLNARRVGEPVRYWDVDLSPAETLSGRSIDDIGHELIERLQEAVSLRLIAEVPLGAFLSGGIDSSAVVAMMSRLSDEPVKTCSIGFDVRDFDETEYARMVAERYGTDHVERLVDPDDFVLVDRLMDYYDEPFADSSSLPTYRVCQLARERVTVALSGDGGDENFIGYRRYRWHIGEERIRSLLPYPLRRVLFGLAGTLYPKMDWAPRFLRAKSTLNSLSLESIQAYLQTVSILPLDAYRKLFRKGFLRRLDGETALERFRSIARSSGLEEPARMIQYLDFKTYLPEDILTKVDRASMAHSLEVRVPLLDHVFVSWVAKIPSTLKLKGREGKYVFKKALEPLLPNEVLYRAKMGFGVPIGRWFRGPLAEELRRRVLGERLLDSGVFDDRYLQTIVSQHQSGIRDHASTLWALMMYDQFLERAERT